MTSPKQELIVKLTGKNANVGLPQRAIKLPNPHLEHTSVDAQKSKVAICGDSHFNCGGRELGA